MLLYDEVNGTYKITFVEGPVEFKPYVPLQEDVDDLMKKDRKRKNNRTMAQIFTGMADEDSDNEEFYQNEEAEKIKIARKKKQEQQIDYEAQHSDDDSFEENINVENEQLNNFGQKIKDALEHPEER